MLHTNYIREIALTTSQTRRLTAVKDMPEHSGTGAAYRGRESERQAALDTLEESMNGVMRAKLEGRRILAEAQQRADAIRTTADADLLDALLEAKIAGITDDEIYDIDPDLAEPWSALKGIIEA